MDEQRDWLALPEEVVDQIGKALLAEDVVSYISFRSVCSFWRRTTENVNMTGRCFCPRKWFLMWGSDKYEPKHFSTKVERSKIPQRHFLNPSHGKYVRVHIPELSNKKINACLEGLLLITGRFGSQVTSRLLNPFTMSMLKYPDISKLYNKLPKSETEPPSITFGDSSSFTILVIASKFVAYAKPGYTEWMVISLGLGRHHSCLFFNGQPYCLSSICGLLPIELEENQKEQVELRERILFKGLPFPLTMRTVQSYYLVESDGCMLLVLKERGVGHSETYFRIFKVKIREDAHSGGDTVSFVLVGNIGNHALFIHPEHGGASFSTDVFPCILPNCIYFYEGGVPLPKIFSPYKYTKPLPEVIFCYWPVESDQFLQNRTFSPFPVVVPRRKGRGDRKITSKYLLLLLCLV